MDNSQEIFVIVLNWNGIDDTLACINSLIQQSYQNIRIVVIDNGSLDDAVPAIKSAYPNITIFENPTNLGFSAGNNLGITYAIEQGAAYILLLNNDTIAGQNMVEKLVNTAQKKAKVAAVGPKILYYEKPEHIWSAGGFLKYHQNVTVMRGYRQRDQGQFQVREVVDYLPGCAMLINSQAVKEVGYLDEIFSPVYFEDLDWCLRARSAGYQILYEPEAEILHKVSISNEYNRTQRYLFSYNSVIFMKRYANIQQWIKFIFLAILSLPFVFIIRSFQGEGRSILARGAGIFDALLNSKRKESYN